MDRTRSELDCSQAWRLIDAQCREGLPGRVALELRLHLAGCPDCRALHRERLAEVAAERVEEIQRPGPDRRVLRRRRLALTFLASCVLIAFVARMDGDWDFDPLVRVERLEGDVWAAGELLGPERGTVPLHRSDLVTTDVGSRARLDAKGLRVELEPRSAVLVVSSAAARLRLEEGAASIDGEGTLETPLGLVEVHGGRARLVLGPDGLDVLADGPGVFVRDARGRRAIQPTRPDGGPRSAG
jgi:hypothetical protein